MAIWTQPMRTHNFKQAQDSGSYAQSIQSWIWSFASKPKQESLAHLGGLQVQFCYTRLCFVTFFFPFFPTNQQKKKKKWKRKKKKKKCKALSFSCQLLLRWTFCFFDLKSNSYARESNFTTKSLAHLQSYWSQTRTSSRKAKFMCKEVIFLKQVLTYLQLH